MYNIYCVYNGGKKQYKSIRLLGVALCCCLNNPPPLSSSFPLGKHFLCSQLVVVMEERLVERASCCCQPGEGFVRLKCEASVFKVMHRVGVFITEMLSGLVLAKSAVWTQWSESPSCHTLNHSTQWAISRQRGDGRKKKMDPHQELCCFGSLRQSSLPCRVCRLLWHGLMFLEFGESCWTSVIYFTGSFRESCADSLCTHTDRLEGKTFTDCRVTSWCVTQLKLVLAFGTVRVRVRVSCSCRQPLISTYFLQNKCKVAKLLWVV